MLNQKREFSLLRLLGTSIVIIGSLAMVLTTFSVISDIKDAPHITPQKQLVSQIPTMGAGSEASNDDLDNLAAYHYADIAPAAGPVEQIYLNDMLQNVSVEYQNGKLIEEK